MRRVSFSLIAIPAGRAREADDVFEWIDRMDDGQLPVAAETAALAALGHELPRAFPDTDGREPIVSLLPGRVEIEIAWTTIGTVAPAVLDIATRYSLDVFDPQSGRVHHVGDELPRGEHWARASTPVQAVISAIERGGPDSTDAISDLASPDAKVRTDTVLGLAWSNDEGSADALRSVLARDASLMVRALAAQSLMIRGETASAPAVATLIRDAAATGDRDALDAAVVAASTVVQAAQNGTLGSRARLDAHALSAVRAAIVAASATAERLRSRHRRDLAAMLEVLDNLH